MRHRHLIALVAFLTCASASADPLQDASDRVVAALKADDLHALEARFDERMKKLFPTRALAERWSSVKADFGALVSCDAPTRDAQPRFTSIDYPCRFERKSVRLRVAIDTKTRLAGLAFDPIEEPARVAVDARAPSPVTEVEAGSGEGERASGGPSDAVTVGAGGWLLPGTLARSPAAARPPGVVFVQDTGGTDRDQSTGPNKPFRDLADGLAKQGIESLRYERRRKVHDQRFAAELPEWTLADDVVDDAVSALALLAARPNGGPLFVLGQGTGGRLVPRIAAAAQAKGIHVAGVVLVASSAQPMADALVDEMEFLASLSTPAVGPEVVDDMKRRRDNVAKLADAKAGMAAKDLPFQWPASAWRELAADDPVQELSDARGLPALLVFGGRDFQVPTRERRQWQLRLGTRPDTTIVEFPAVNHWMIEGRGAIGPAEYAKPGHVAQDVIDRIASWIRSRSTGR